MSVKELLVDNLEGWDLVRSVEPEAHDLLLRFMQKKKYKINSVKADLFDLLPDYSSYAWQVEEPEFYLDNKGRMLGGTVLHQAIHSLIAERFGHARKGFPRLTLLNECIGIGYSFLLGFHLFSRGDRDILMSAMTFAVQHRLPIRELIDEAAQDPFETAKKVGLECFRYYTFLLDGFRKGTPPLNQLKETTELLRSSRHVPFFMDYSGSASVRYAIAFCGPESSAEDLKAVTECIGLLNKSASFYEFVKHLGVEKFAA